MPALPTRRRSAAARSALALGLLLVTAGAPAVADEEPAPLREKFTITIDSANPARGFEAFDAAAVGLYDLDGDGSHELIANNDNNRAYVFDGATGRLLGEVATRHPSSWNARELNGIAVGDVNANAVPDLVIANSASWVSAFEARPPVQPDGDWEFVELWANFIDPTELDPDYLENNTQINGSWDGYAGLDGAAYLADVDGDGKDEAFLQTDDAPGHYGLEDNGSVSWWTDYGDGNGNPVVADLDGNGRHEVAFGTDGGRIHVYDARTGDPRCTFSTRAHGSDPGSISVAPAVVDLNGDGKLELVFGARQAEESDAEDWIQNQHAHYYAIDHRCGLMWTQAFEWGNPHVYMHPAPVDVNGDGALDVVIHDWNTIGHKPGNWETTGRANLFALDGRTGDLLWRTTTSTYWSNKDVAIADLRNGDAPEILAVSDQGGTDGILVLDLQGNDVDFLPAGDGWSVSRGPSVGDVDGDELAEVVFPVHRKSDHCPPRDLDVGCREGAIRVFETEKPLHAPWSGNLLYNAAIMHGDAPRHAPELDVDVTVMDSEPGVFAVDAPGVTHAWAKRPGDAEWTPLRDADGARWDADLAPLNDETFVLRLVKEGPRVGHRTLAWHGSGPGHVTGHVEGAGAFGNVTVRVVQNGTILHEAPADAAGDYAFDLPAGDYAFVPVGDGMPGAPVNLTLGPGELRTVDVHLAEEPEESGFFSIPAPGSLLAFGAFAAAGVALARRRGCQP